VAVRARTAVRTMSLTERFILNPSSFVCGLFVVFGSITFHSSLRSRLSRARNA